jgi:hypothetical protein
MLELFQTLKNSNMTLKRIKTCTPDNQKNIFAGILFFSFPYYIQHCFIRNPSDSTVPTDAGIDPRTDATGALEVRCSKH